MTATSYSPARRDLVSGSPAAMLTLVLPAGLPVKLVPNGSSIRREARKGSLKDASQAAERPARPAATRPGAAEGRGHCRAEPASGPRHYRSLRQHGAQRRVEDLDGR